MLIMQKIKFMQEFTFTINVECLQCITAHVQNMQKHLLLNIKDFESSVEWKISAYDAHIQE